jgi:outer membrane protein assembly factor BamB
LVDDLLYLVNDNGLLVCLEAKTGEEVWRERFSGKFGPSLLHADNRIYVHSKRGETIVFAPGRAYQELAVNTLDGSFSASPVVAGDTLLLRSETHLYRIKGGP